MRFRETDGGKTAEVSAVISAALVAFLCLSYSISHAQEYTISKIDVKGNKTVDRTLILSVADLRSGSILTSTATQDAIKRIYGLGLFGDVRIEGDIAGDSVAIYLVVKEFPRLKNIYYYGNDGVDKKDLDEVVTIKQGQVVSPHRLQESKTAMLEIYKEKGYYLADVNYDTGEEDKDGFVDVTYNIDERRKVRIKTIEFIGNQAFADGKLRGRMSNKQKGFFRSGSFNKSEYPEDKEKIIQFYNEKGYIDARIVRDTIIVHDDQKRMTIQIEVEEGLRYRFGMTTFAGQELFTESQLASKLKFDEGDIYNREKYEESVGELYSMYQDEGYIHARIFDNVSTRDSIVNISFEISEGLPAEINLVKIEGNTKTKEKVIRRELFSSPGQIFRRSVLVRSVRNVMLLNYFEKVEPDFKVLDNGDVDLILKIVEKPTGQFNVGAGYSARDKLVGTVGLGIPNFRGNGQNVGLNIEFGGRRNSLSLSFTEPWFMDTPTSLGFDLYSRNLRWYDYFTEERRGGSIRLGRRLRWPDDYFRIYWSYRLEGSRYYDISRDGALDFWWLVGRGREWNSSVSITILRDSRDLPQFATSGSILSLQSEYSGGPLGGNSRYDKHILTLSKFHKLFWKFSLALKARYGVIFAPRGDALVPYAEKFSPGGTDPDGFIRGYDDSRVTPRSETGGYLRGRSMVVYNAEIQIPLVEQQVYGLLLADAGNSWLLPRDLRPFDPGSLYGSYGFGFRLVVPGIGIIGFDIARGISTEDNRWKPHFQIGTTF